MVWANIRSGGKATFPLHVEGVLTLDRFVHTSARQFHDRHAQEMS